MKLIGCTDSESSNGGVLDPVDPNPFVAVASASCWAACNSAIRAGEFVTWFTLTEDPCGRRTTVSPGSSTRMCPRDSLLGDEFECAVLEVLVGDVAVVQERDVRVGGPDFLHQREGQCCEPQHAEPAGTGPALGIANRGLSGSAIRELEGAETGRCLNAAGDAGKQGRQRPCVHPGLAWDPPQGARPEHAFQPRLRSKYPGAASRRLAAETSTKIPQSRCAGFRLKRSNPFDPTASGWLPPA